MVRVIDSDFDSGRVHAMRMKTVLSVCLVISAFLLAPVSSHAQISVGIAVHIGPPALPVYVQPPVPEPGYIWTPGYWAYGPDGYYWVPGAWVAPPEPGYLWTPGYWAFNDGSYFWRAGYWGPHVGYYGGINYGYGYTGVGFVGGYWRGGSYFYNRSVTNVNVTVVHNTYINNRVINRTVVNRASFNGVGGVNARPTAFERRYENERHFQPTSVQARHEHLAGGNRSLLVSTNHGRPSIAATSRAGEFNGRGVVAARAAGAGRNGDFRNNRFERGNPGPGRNSPNFNADNSRGFENGRRNGSNNEARPNERGFNNERGGPNNERGGFRNESGRFGNNETRPNERGRPNNEPRPNERGFENQSRPRNEGGSERNGPRNEPAREGRQEHEHR